MLRQLCIFFFISLVSFSVSAEDDIRYYDVEFILFENTNAQYRQSEDWQTRRRPIETEQEEPVHELGQPYAMDPKSSYDRDAMFTLLPKSQQRLTEEAKLIEKSPNRRILVHLAWRQPGLPKEKAVWVHFKKILGNTGAKERNKHMTATGLSGEHEFSPYVDGKVKVMLARYLHVDTDILYFAHPSTDAVTETTGEIETLDEQVYGDVQPVTKEPNVFLMNQLRRRIRSKELHYLDHPVMGMLLLITPYEKPEQAN
ncbi:MAG: CsiV family protein [Gammaproteobacteria bacterium]|jgi:hypothetical protein